MRKTAYLLIFIVVRLMTSAPFASELPDAEIKAHLKKQDMPKLQARTGSRLQSDYEARWLKWFERRIVQPFAARLQNDVTVRERALHLVRKGIMNVRHCQQRDTAFSADKMVAECESVLKAGVDDPLIHWLHGLAIYSQSQDFPGFEAAYKKAARHPQFKASPAVQRLLTMQDCERIASESRRAMSAAPRGEEIIKVAWESLQENSYQPDEDEILDENLWPIFRKEVLPKDEPLVLKICSVPTLSPWASQMLTGRYHERKAWLARGHEFADKVKPEGWAGFEQSRLKAIECFSKAWKLRPETPVAARELLGITMTGGDTGEKPQVWLQRALDAQFDHLPTFRSMMNGLLPRWGGSHQQMLAFGLSCAATKRFDTEVPYYFLEVLRDLARDAADWRKVCGHPLVAQVTVALCKQRVQDAPTPAMKDEALMLLGGYAWVCGDYEAAADALALVDKKFTRQVVVQMLPFTGWNEQIIRAESAIFAVGYQEQWRAAERALADKDLATAEDGYRTIRAQLEGVSGAELADSRLAAVKFERGLAAGGWVQMGIDPTLAGWQNQKGDWTGTADGHLINRGKGASAFIFHQGRVGTEFQMRGEFIAEKSGFGILIGHGDSEQGVEQWMTCVMKRDEAYFLDRYFKCGLEKRKIKPPASPTSFLITCHAGKVSFEVGGQKVFTEAVPSGYYAPHPPLPLTPDGHVGFCLPMFDKDNLSTILRCEVRLLPPDFKL
jgi:hypothetical protein